MILRKRPAPPTLAAQVEDLRRKRKTGRLTLTYPEGHGDLYFKTGELVDAKVDQVIGPGAIFLALTLQNITFKFDPTIHSTQRTIYDSWEVLVSNAQRQLNEGNLPSELFLQDDEFETAWSSLLEKPLSSVRRTAVYRASLSKWRALLDFATSLIHRFTTSIGWGIALASAIFAFVVLMTISIVAINYGFEQRPPDIVPAEQNTLLPDSPARPARSQAATAAASSSNNSFNTGHQSETGPTTTTGTPAESIVQPESAPTVKDGDAASKPTAVPMTDQAATATPTTAPPAEEVLNDEPEIELDENDVPEPEPPEDDPADGQPEDS